MVQSKSISSPFLKTSCLLTMTLGALVTQLSATTRLSAEQEQKVDLTGKVVNAKGEPLKFAKVILLFKSWTGGYHQRVFTSKTDMSGTFSFEKRHALGERNSFLLTVFADGYAMDSRYLRNPSGEPNKGLRIVLEKAIPKQLTVMVNGQRESNAKIVPLSRLTNTKKRHFIYAQSIAQTALECNQQGQVKMAFFQPGDLVEFKLVNSELSKTIHVVIDNAPTQIVNFTSSERVDSPVNKRWIPEPAKVNEVAVDWIRKNSVPFRSVDPADENFDDLMPLKKLIGDARIVQLGEQSHGDGKCFLTKVRLVKFLHQEMGFDVLAFESGIYDCSQAWRALQKPNTPVEAAKLGVFGIWTGSRQTRELWRYVSDRVVARQPLELTGFDCQFTGLGSKRHLLDELQEVLSQDEFEMSETDSNFFLMQIRTLVNGKIPAGDQKRFNTIAEKLISKLNNELRLSTVGGAGYWRQQIKSMCALGNYRWSTKKKRPSSFGINQRDLQMAKNLIWLAEEKFRDRKIIVWAANFHITRNPKEIEVPDNSVDYSQITPMGHHVFRRLGDETYTIGFTAYEGQAGAYFRKPFAIAAAPAGTFEDLCVRAGLENGLIPLRDQAGESWLQKKIPARPLGYSWMKAKWGEHFDALIINKTMEPSTR